MKLFLLLLSAFLLNAYELPQINLSNDKKPEIVLFTAKSIKKGDKLLYEIKWKTINATDVNITYLGKLDLSGTLIVTDEEYNNGVITIQASSNTSEYIDKKFLNKQKSDDELTPISKKASANDSENYNENDFDDISQYNNYRRRQIYRQDMYRRHPGRYQ